MAFHHLVELHDQRRGAFLDLGDVLAALPPVAGQLEWRILAIDAIPIDRPSVDLRAYLSLGLGHGQGRAGGYPVSLVDLGVLADNTIHIPEALIVAPHPDRPLPAAADDDLAILAACEVVLAAFDAAYWSLWIPSDWLASIEAAFADVRPVEPGTRPLTA